jgi:hypothetical protein
MQVLMCVYVCVTEDPIAKGKTNLVLITPIVEAGGIQFVIPRASLPISSVWLCVYQKSKRTYYLQFANQQDQDEWLHAIESQSL